MSCAICFSEAFIQKWMKTKTKVPLEFKYNANVDGIGPEYISSVVFL